MVVPKWLAVTGIWLSVLCLAVYLETGVRASRERLRQRMTFGLTRKKDETNRVSFVKRLVRTILGFGSLVARKRTLVTLQDRIDAAGNPWQLTAAEVTGMKMIVGAGMAVVAGYAFYLLGNPAMALIMAPTVFLLCQVLPSFLLGRIVTRRKNEMERQLPNFMDIVTLAVESGLGLDAAVATAVDKFGGPLGQEFATALREIGFGLARRAALLNIVERNKEVRSLRNVLVAIVQAERFGMGMGRMLRVQTGQLRLERRARVEEAVQKMPVKMLFPLVFLILPSLFTVILGPALIEIMNMGVL